MDEYFDKNVRPAFEAMQWNEQEIQALRGAFFLGVHFAIQRIDADEPLDAIRDRYDDITH